MNKYLLILFVLASASTFASGVYDPTQPKQIYVATDLLAVDEDMVEPVEVLRLQGVLEKRNSKIAIISGELYQRGDKVDGYLISEIHRNHVVMVGSGTQKRLFVYE